MTIYDYRESMKDDILDFVSTHADEIHYEDFDDIDDLKEYLDDLTEDEDSITGAGSGNYCYQTTEEASEKLCYNFDLMSDAWYEGYLDSNTLREGPCACDAAVRCYLLWEVINTVCEDYLKDDFDSAHKENNH